MYVTIPALSLTHVISGFEPSKMLMHGGGHDTLTILVQMTAPSTFNHSQVTNADVAPAKLVTQSRPLDVPIGIAAVPFFQVTEVPPPDWVHPAGAFELAIL